MSRTKLLYFFYFFLFLNKKLFIFEQKKSAIQLFVFLLKLFVILRILNFQIV